MTRVWDWIAIAALTSLIACNHASPDDDFAAEATQAKGRPKLVFSLDQGFSNGLVALADGANPGYLAALDRVISTLRVYQTKYDVYALLNPMPSLVIDPAHPANREKERLNFVLATLVDAGIPFVLDVYSSDTYQIARYSPSINYAQFLLNGVAMQPSDPVHPDNPSPFVLDYYVARYGSMFAGIRIFETGSMSLTMRRCSMGGDCSWLGGAPPLPVGDFFQAPIASGFADYAAAHGMFVIWSDPIWTLPELTDGLATRTFAQDFLDKVFRPSLANITAAHPGVVYPMYANNDEHHLDHFYDWQGYVQFAGMAGFGLSDQSWNCYGTPWDDQSCPAQDVANWATTALARGAQMVEVEPFWYGTQWHEVSGNRVAAIEDNLVADIDWTTAGYPTSAGTYLAAQLGIDLNTVGTQPSSSSSSPSPPAPPAGAPPPPAAPAVPPSAPAQPSLPPASPPPPPLGITFSYQPWGGSSAAVPSGASVTVSGASGVTLWYACANATDAQWTRQVEPFAAVFQDHVAPSGAWPLPPGTQGPVHLWVVCTDSDGRTLPGEMHATLQ
jgi:hypothetical protein